MPVDVILRFLPPEGPDIGALVVFEAPGVDGPFTQIDRTTAVGTFPYWITYYITRNATTDTDWFSIAWEDTSGAVGEMSDAVPGHTETLVSKLLSRVILRDPTLDENVVVQVVEYVVADVMKTNDPYDVSLTTTYAQMEGMTLLALARIKYQTVLDGGESYTAGLVSEKQTSFDPVKIMKSVEMLIREANRVLGRRFSVVAQMVVPEINRGLSRVVMADISRLQIDVE
jgi:hypothetical protein